MQWGLPKMILKAMSTDEIRQLFDEVISLNIKKYIDSLQQNRITLGRKGVQQDEMLKIHLEDLVTPQSPQTVSQRLLDELKAAAEKFKTEAQPVEPGTLRNKWQKLKKWAQGKLKGKPSADPDSSGDDGFNNLAVGLDGRIGGRRRHQQPRRGK